MEKLRKVLYPQGIENLTNNDTSRRLFSFYRPILLLGFDLKTGKNGKETILKYFQRNDRSLNRVSG